VTRTLCWYGDDFTGSTDVLEALAPVMPSVLFLAQPGEREFAPFAEYAAFGLAGATRSESPTQMEAHLPASLAWLRSLGAGLCHYKVCSTFDSSPHTGSIGRALEIGARVFGGRFVPVVPGSPPLGRYTAFGHLFAAAADGRVYRIDRHPTMSQHPVTPMRESDLRVHLRAQTDASVDLLDLNAPAAAYASTSAQAVLIDVLDDATLRRAGRWLWDGERQPFVIGSSGVEYALLAHWNLPRQAAPALTPVDRLVVLSGSCSPNTQRQIEHAGTQGLALLPVDAQDTSHDEAVIERALRALGEATPGVVIYTSETRVDTLDAAGRLALGERSGRLLARVLDAAPEVRRVIVAGGDTSSHAGRQLGVDALTFVTHLAPGAPLCRAWSRQANRDGLEIVFKGGQCGAADFFSMVRGH